MNTLILVPAYGRDYHNAEDVIAAYKAGKDFLIQDISSRWDGKPANMEDLAKSYDTVKLRYLKHTRFVFLNAKTGSPTHPEEE